MKKIIADFKGITDFTRNDDSTRAEISDNLDIARDGALVQRDGFEVKDDSNPAPAGINNRVDQLIPFNESLLIQHNDRLFDSNGNEIIVGAEPYDIAFTDDTMAYNGQLYWTNAGGWSHSGSGVNAVWVAAATSNPLIYNGASADTLTFVKGERFIISIDGDSITAGSASMANSATYGTDIITILSIHSDDNYKSGTLNWTDVEISQATWGAVGTGRTDILCEANDAVTFVPHLTASAFSGNIDNYRIYRYMKHGKNSVYRQHVNDSWPSDELDTNAKWTLAGMAVLKNSNYYRAKVDVFHNQPSRAFAEEKWEDLGDGRDYANAYNAVDYTIWKDHLITTYDLSPTDFLRQPKKIWYDSQNEEYRATDCGLPRPIVYNQQPYNLGYTHEYIARVHFEYEYKIGGTEYLDRGPYTQFEWCDNSEIGAAPNQFSFSIDTAMLRANAALDLSNMWISISRTVKDGSTFYVAERQRLCRDPKTMTGNNSSDAVEYESVITDSQLVVKELHYAEGGILENDPAPCAKYVTTAKDCVWYGNIIDTQLFDTEYEQSPASSKERKKGSLVSLTTNYPNVCIADHFGTAVTANYDPYHPYHHTPNYQHPYRVRQSIPGDPDSCPESIYADLDEDVTGLGTINDLPIAFTANEVYRIDGIVDQTGAGFLRAVKIADTVGCINHKSIVSTDQGLFFASKDGFYVTDGYSVKLISERLPDTYKAYTATTTQIEKINGTYDYINKRVLWSMKSTEGSSPEINIYDSDTNDSSLGDMGDIGNAEYIAQSFIPSANTYVTGVSVMLDGYDVTTYMRGNLVAEIWSDNAGDPDTTLVTSASRNLQNLHKNDDEVQPWVRINFGEAYLCTASTKYWVVLRVADLNVSSSGQQLSIRCSTSSQVDNVNMKRTTNSGTNWTNYADYDMVAQIHGRLPASDRANDTDKIVIYDISQGEFYTYSADNYYFSSIVYDDGKLFIGDASGFVMKQTEDLSHDEVIDDADITSSGWSNQTILYNRKSVIDSYGHPDSRKWFTTITIMGNRDTDINIQVSSYEDGGSTENKLDEVVITGSNISYEETKYFPGNSIRALTKQVQIKNDDSQTVDQIAHIKAYSVVFKPLKDPKGAE